MDIYKIIDFTSIFITLLASILSFVIPFILHGINKKTEAKQLEIKYDLDKMFSLKEDNEKCKIAKEESIKIKESYLHKLLELHHNQALQQANIQFWFSIFAAILGFVLIIIIIIFGQSETWYENIIKATPGAIIEVVSVLFINQARETRDRATNFFMELNYDRKIEKSIEIVDSIERDEIRADVKAKIALHIIGINEELDNQ